MKFDIDRIHRVLNGLDRDRGCGKTTAIAFGLMMGEVYLGEEGNSYLYVGEDHIHARYVKEFFLEIIKEANIKAIGYHAKDTVEVNGMIFRFLGPGNNCTVRGCSFDDIWIDVSDTTAEHYRESINMLQYCKRNY